MTDRELLETTSQLLNSIVTELERIELQQQENHKILVRLDEKGKSNK